MSLCQRDVIVRWEQCQDLLRQAARERLAQRVLSTARATWYCRALLWLGGRLQSWGQRLVEMGRSSTVGERLRYGSR
jgi:hypothetical protein